MASSDRSRLLLLSALSGMTAFAQNAPGVAPRKASADYQASTQAASCTYAASLLSVDQVKHIFAVDISKTYLVFEVAVYPAPNARVNVSPDDFIIRSGKNSEFIHSAEAVTVASVMQHKSSPGPQGTQDVSIYPSATVGYESGTDPYTGRRVHGTYTEVGVGVEKAPGYDPRYPPPPAIDPQQVQLLEDQLAAKALKGGDLTGPIAGYLYFPASGTKRSSDGTYKLEYLDGGAAKIQLNVPSKAR